MHPLRAVADDSGNDTHSAIDGMGIHAAAAAAALVAALVVAMFVGRGRGLVGGAIATVQFIVLVLAAMIAGGYVAHSATILHSDRKLALGVSYNLSGV